MGILDIASSTSIWRGYDYFENNRVVSFHGVDKTIFEGIVQGNTNEPYQVTLDIAHPKRSVCNCPHAEGTRRICKHKIALYFSIFPDEAKRLIEEAQAYEEEQEEWYEAVENEIKKHLNKLNKKELIELVYNMLMCGPEWQFDEFVRDNLDL